MCSGNCWISLAVEGRRMGHQCVYADLFHSTSPHSIIESRTMIRSWWFRNPKANHLGWCWNLVNHGINYYINWLAGFQPSTVGPIKAYTHNWQYIYHIPGDKVEVILPLLDDETCHKTPSFARSWCSFATSLGPCSGEHWRLDVASGFQHTRGGNRREWESGEEHRILTQVNSSF